MSEFPAGDLLREVARTQRDRTINDVLILLDITPTYYYKRDRFTSTEYSAKQWHDQVIEKIRGLRDDS